MSEHTPESDYIRHGDCLAIMAAMPEASVDAVVTDPPYGLEFGDKGDGEVRRANRGGMPNFLNDKGQSKFVLSAPAFDLSPQGRERFTSWCEDWAREALRVLKPGGHVVAFGGTRTWHLLATGVEAAGFELRDNIAWLHGQGFPRSRSLQKALDKAGHDGSAWEGWGTTLRPSFEPAILARRPLAGRIVDNVVTHGTSGLNIRAGRHGDRWPANAALDDSQAAELADGARFFFSPKAPPKERPKVDGVAHPTVKPLALMRWLVRLVTPPGGVVLDPFAGSGTTLEAALLEGFTPLGIELAEEYIPLINARLSRVARAQSDLFGGVA